MLLLIDNYDSFTFNLYHFLGDVGAMCEVWRNDKISVADALARAPKQESSGVAYSEAATRAALIA